MTVTYTHYYEPEASSVISQVWYNSQAREMFVQLHNGTLCGYRDVDPKVYEAFTSQEKLGASIGSYWNRFIKPALEGISTTDLYEDDFVMSFPNDDARFEFVDNSSGDVHSIDTPSGSFDMVDNTSAKVVNLFDDDDEEEVEYEIIFDVGSTDDNEITVRAGSDAEALARLDAIASMAGWKDVKVRSVTRRFD